MQDKELIEQLQPHNLPHMADGSFNITAKQHAAILSLLSQQEVVVESEAKIREAIENALYATKRYLTTEASELADGIMEYLKDTGTLKTMK